MNVHGYVLAGIVRGKITPQQRRICMLLALDRGDKEIAVEIGVQVQTLKDYMKNLRKRTGLRRCGLAVAGYLLSTHPENACLLEKQP